MGTDIVRKVFTDWGREHAFERRGARFLAKRRDHVVVMLELQQSDYGRSYYLNVGFAFPELHQEPVKRFAQADFWTRAEDLLDFDPLLRRLLDTENEIEDGARESGLRGLLDRLLPNLSEPASVSSFRALASAGGLPHGFFSKEAADLLRAASQPTGADNAASGDPDHEPGEPLLRIQTVLGGGTPVNAAWSEPIGRVTHRLALAAGNVSLRFGVAVVLWIPGHLTQPKFVGVRVGAFSRSEQVLTVDVALPEAPPHDPVDFLVKVLFEAIDEVGRWAQGRRVQVDLSELRSVVEDAKHGLDV